MYSIVGFNFVTKISGMQRRVVLNFKNQAADST
jgi:hypothetical protein